MNIYKFNNFIGKLIHGLKKITPITILFIVFYLVYFFAVGVVVNGTGEVCLCLATLAVALVMPICCKLEDNLSVDEYYYDDFM